MQKKKISKKETQNSIRWKIQYVMWCALPFLRTAKHKIKGNERFILFVNKLYFIQSHWYANH